MSRSGGGEFDEWWQVWGGMLPHAGKVLPVGSEERHVDLSKTAQRMQGVQYLNGDDYYFVNIVKP